MDRVRTAQAANKAATVSAKETTAAAQEVTGRLKWLEIHIKARPGAATEAVSAGADRVC